ncbi:hypothetical protein DL770_005481 [Monosporascus sp. CRB-9-2]|nr:hypothetical protein DL770_005481 [Monosporascus sp. CRB-9-2]
MKQLPVRTLICSGTPSGFSRLWSHLEALNAIAFENGNGNRAFGLPGYAASVDYIWSHIANVTGIRAWKQDFPAWFGLVESTSFKVDDKELYVYGITYSPFTSEGGVSSEIVLGPPDEEGYYAANYNGLDVKGKIVLTQRCRCPTGGTLAGRVRPAKEAGAAAVIIYHDLTTTPTAGSMGEINLDAYAHRASSTAPMARRSLSASRLAKRPKPFSSSTIATSLTSSRLWHSITLEVFKVLQNYRFKNKVRFTWWRAEENGLLGSRYYCANLEPAEIDNLLTYLDFDMVSKGYWGASDNDGRAHGSVAPAGGAANRHHVDRPNRPSYAPLDFPDISSKTVLFVGCGGGLADPNFGKLLEWIGGKHRKRGATHYILLQKDEANPVTKPALNHVKCESFDDIGRWLGDQLGENERHDGAMDEIPENSQRRLIHAWLSPRTRLNFSVTTSIFKGQSTSLTISLKVPVELIMIPLKLPMGYWKNQDVKQLNGFTRAHIDTVIPPRPNPSSSDHDSNSSDVVNGASDDSSDGSGRSNGKRSSGSQIGKKRAKPQTGGKRKKAEKN